MFWLAQDKSGGWYAFSGYGRIGYAARMVRITGPTTQETAMRAMQSKINKKVGKGYTNVSRDFGMNAEESGKFMTFGEISYQYEYEDPSDGPLDSYDVQSIQRAVEGYISDDGGRDGEGVFAHYASDNDIVISVSWTHKYSGINSAEEVQAGLPVIPDSYGTNSALSSGQGVPQWYGSAEHHMTLSDLSDTPFGAFVKPDGTVIMVISDKSVKGKEQEAIDWGLNHFGKQYEGVKFVKYSSEYDAETFEAPMPFYPPSKGDVDRVQKAIRSRHQGIRFKGSPTYLTERKDGSNKYHVFQMTNRGGFNGYGRIGHTMSLFGPMSPQQYQSKLKSKMRKGYRETGF